MACIGVSEGEAYSLLARRNNSLSRSGRWLAFAGISAVSAGIALGMASFGAYLVLPFAGIEIAILYAVFRWVDQHAGDYERVTVNGERLELEVAERGEARRFEWNSRWVQVTCADDGRRLVVRYRARETEFGRHLTPGQRLAVARTLRQELRRSR